MVCNCASSHKINYVGKVDDIINFEEEAENHINGLRTTVILLFRGILLIG